MLCAIPNLSSMTASRTDPWDCNTETPPDEAMASKDAFIKWCQKPTTKNCHFSAFEGLDPLRRVGGDNPVLIMHGLVADYDAKCTEEMILSTVAESPTEFAPNYGSNTFSGGGRLVWLFEEPVTVPNMEVAITFQKLVMKKMKLTKYLPGFDMEAFVDPCRYFEKGRLWQLLTNDKIPSNMVWQWLYEAGGKRKWDSQGELNIPMDRIAAEVQKQYPNKWKGTFEDGARGTRFWDETADNSTAAVVRGSGMQCFTGDQGFIPWHEILGQSFVDRYRANATGAIIKDSFYDGKHYWVKGLHDYWVNMTKDDMRLRLKVKYGLSATPGKKDNFSDVDRVVHAMQEQKSVTSAAPFIHKPQGLCMFEGRRYLNTSDVRCLEPSARDITEWGDGFPWLASYLDGFFEPKEQLDYFLSWWKHFYEHGLKQKPRTGHALFIAGDTNVGKTLMSTGMISRTVGGNTDASAFLLGDSNFTSHVISSPIMSVDDTHGASDARKHTVYSSNVKKVVANRHQLFEEKHVKAGMVEWLGRVIVTMNMDDESSKLLPNCDISIMDKIMLLRCAPGYLEFPEPEEMERIKSEELPCFCRWLLNWKIPDHCKGDVRFGVTPYHDKHLYNAAIQASGSYSFFELLTDFLQQLPDDEVAWEGTSTRLIADMCLDERIAVLANKYSPAQAASILGQLKSRGFKLERIRSSSQRIWRIPTNIMDKQEKVDDGTK